MERMPFGKHKGQPITEVPAGPLMPLRDTANGAIWTRRALHLAVLEQRVKDLDARLRVPGTRGSGEARRERSALRWAMAIIRMQAPEGDATQVQSDSRVRFERVYGPPLSVRADGDNAG